MQQRYILVPAYEYFGKKHRAITYTVDYCIIDNKGILSCVDVKGFGTQQGDLRRKLFQYHHPTTLLLWTTRNLKYGDKDGWIDYDELKSIRKKNKQ